MVGGKCMVKTWLVRADVGADRVTQAQDVSIDAFQDRDVQVHGKYI